jgi:hypothetical protein
MRQWKLVTLSTVSALVVTAALLVAGAATAASVTPTTVEGNINVVKSGNNYGCVDFVNGEFVGVQTSSPVADGQVQYTGNTPNSTPFTLTVIQHTLAPGTEGNSIDFSITGGVVLVAAVKGASNFNVYNYQPTGGATADTDLRAPNFPGRISHYVFCIGNANPSAVTFRSASAVRTKAGVVVRWKTAAEVDTLGFNVYRLVKGKLVHANKHLILVHGGTYSFLDRKAPSARNLRYRIQAVHADGSRSWFGPLAVKRQS